MGDSNAFKERKAVQIYKMMSWTKLGATPNSFVEVLPHDVFLFGDKGFRI